MSRDLFINVLSREPSFTREIRSPKIANPKAIKAEKTAQKTQSFAKQVFREYISLFPILRQILFTIFKPIVLWYINSKRDKVTQKLQKIQFRKLWNDYACQMQEHGKLQNPLQINSVTFSQKQKKILEDAFSTPKNRQLLGEAYQYESKRGSSLDKILDTYQVKKKTDDLWEAQDRIKGKVKKIDDPNIFYGEYVLDISMKKEIKEISEESNMTPTRYNSWKLHKKILEMVRSSTNKNYKQVRKEIQTLLEKRSKVSLWTQEIVNIALDHMDTRENLQKTLETIVQQRLYEHHREKAIEQIKKDMNRQKIYIDDRQIELSTLNASIDHIKVYANGDNIRELLLLENLSQGVLAPVQEITGLMETPYTEQSEKVLGYKLQRDENTSIYLDTKNNVITVNLDTDYTVNNEKKVKQTKSAILDFNTNIMTLSAHAKRVDG